MGGGKNTTVDVKNYRGTV